MGTIVAEPLSKASILAPALLAWYDRHRRTLPWRAQPHEKPDPYRIWLSEIMLQQTTVATVGGYFDRFVTRFPTVEALAAAPLDNVLHAWQGMGYYARARNLHACARAVVAEHGGRFPDTEAGLRALPGIGPYTAAAIAAIAFDRKAAAVDGNVERVIARLAALGTPLPSAKPEIRALVEPLVPDARAGDFAQALMDLGATICTPRAPKCILCPWQSACRARALGITEELPRRRESGEADAARHRLLGGAARRLRAAAQAAGERTPGGHDRGALHRVARRPHQ
jgi:A/G-specific adenine glycosylase